jgi:hypothetical protein
MKPPDAHWGHLFVAPAYPCRPPNAAAYRRAKPPKKSQPGGGFPFRRIAQTKYRTSALSNLIRIASVQKIDIGR